MAKTIFGTSEKSNFILNMDLDRYRQGCGKLTLIVFWATAIAQLISHMLGSSEVKLAQIFEGGGFAGAVIFLLLLLRRVSLIFSLAGVFALFATVIGLMRKQFSKATAVPYLLTVASLVWAMISRFHSYDLKISLFGFPGREEGWFALLMYGGIFYLGTMLRRKSDLERFGRGLMILGIAECVVGFVQAIPLFDFLNPDDGLNPYRNIDPLLLWNTRLPAGMCSSPITYAMKLGMFGALAVPASLLAEEKKTRVLGTVCMFCSIVMALKTQTIAGVIAAAGILLTALILLVLKKQQAKSKAAAGLALCGAVCGVVWILLTPKINQTYFRPDKAHVQPGGKGFTVTAWEKDVSDITLPSGLTLAKSKDGNTYPALYDGGIVWDDGFYRVSTAGSYYPSAEHDFEIYDAASVLRYCWKQGVKAIKIDPLLGVGPDNFPFTQMRTSLEITANANAVDNPYNEYLYIAATRGIPSLLMHLAMLVCCFVLVWKRRGIVQSWVRLAACCAVALYAVTALVGMSVLTVAPVFWALLGVMAAEPIAEKAAAPKPEQTGKKSDKKEKANA
ncbi:MAG: O-antigen ligase family protein [Oscillospiraceae bacterium]|nr:O-antigen ligase family protein [Oscillospiraceae bacterium]